MRKPLSLRIGRVVVGLIAILSMLSGLSASPASALEAIDEMPMAPSTIEGSTPEPDFAAIFIPEPSCVGEDACYQGPTITGTNSCIGDLSCYQGPSEVGDNSCVGFQNCYQASGFSGLVFGSDSCNGVKPCYQSSGDVGETSCNGLNACMQQAMDIGNDSCNGETACMQQQARDADPEGFGDCPLDFPCGTVGNNSCNGLDACLQNFSNVGNNSCNGEAVCVHQDETVGDCEFNSVAVTKCVGAVKPVITINTSGDDVAIDASLEASFSCADTGGFKLEDCTAKLDGDKIKSGDAISTATSGTKKLEVTATDSSGNTATSFLKINVLASEVDEKPVDEKPVVKPRVLTGDFAKATGINGSVARMYIAVFKRQPDAGGHAFWVDGSAKGMTLWEIASLFVASEEFAATYDDLNNTEFVELLYLNVMGREGDKEGIAYWTGLLDKGTLNRGGITLMFAESTEFKVITKTT